MGWRGRKRGAGVMEVVRRLGLSSLPETGRACLGVLSLVRTVLLSSQ